MAGDSQQVMPQRGNATQDLGGLAAPAGVGTAGDSFVTVSQDSESYREASKGSPSESTSTLGSRTMAIPAGQARSEDRTASPASVMDDRHLGSSQAGSWKQLEQEIVAVLAMDNERQHQLEDTAALWQVALIFLLTFPNDEHDRCYAGFMLRGECNSCSGGYQAV